MGREPSGQAPQFRYHGSVFSLYQGDDAPSGKRGSLIANDVSEVSGTEKFRDVPVNRGEAVIGFALEQLGGERKAKPVGMAAAAWVQGGVLVLVVRLAV